MNKHTITSTTSSSSSVSLPLVTPAFGVHFIEVPGGDTGGDDSELAVLEKAVYAHLRALRALGRTSANTAEIASALRISISDVESTLQSLLQKGVKVTT